MKNKTKMLLAVVASSAIAGTAFANPRDARSRRDAVSEGVVDDLSGTGVAEDRMTAQDRQVLAWAKSCGEQISSVINGWIKDGKITRERMFSFLYFPQPDTDPVKFTTEYDTWADTDIFPIQEECLARSPSLRFVVTVDKHGYLPTHNQRFSQALTGMKQIDLVNNRTKRVFNDRTGIRAARNTSEFLLQVYFRDTGEVMKDLSVPLMIEGRHWGGLRFGYVSE